MSRVSRILMLLALATVCSTGHAAVSVAPPEMVGVLIDAGEASVTWTPVPDVGVTYKVYGINGAPELLGATSSTHFKANGAFATFGVSAVVNGVESDIRRACIKADLNSIPPWVGPSHCPQPGGNGPLGIGKLPP